MGTIDQKWQILVSVVRLCEDVQLQMLANKLMHKLNVRLQQMSAIVGGLLSQGLLYSQLI